MSESASEAWHSFRGRSVYALPLGIQFCREEFHNLGIDWTPTAPTSGNIVSGNIPARRRVQDSDPARYCQNGALHARRRFATLEQVIDFYDQGGITNLICRTSSFH